MKNKNVIRINESQLKQIVSESVMKVLNEESYRDAAKKGDYTSTTNKHLLNYKKKHENDKDVAKHFHKFTKKHNLDKTKSCGSAVCNYEDGCNDDGKYVNENLIENVDYKQMFYENVFKAKQYIEQALSFVDTTTEKDILVKQIRKAYDIINEVSYFINQRMK